MAYTDVAGGGFFGNDLQKIMGASDIVPGSSPSYELCKTIYTSHVLGAKLAEMPVQLAMNESRDLDVMDGPGDRVKAKFLEEWEALGCDKVIESCATLSRVYGVASVVMVAEGVESIESIDPWKLPDLNIAFNVLDPLNTAGSLVLNQDANAIDFLKPSTVITAAGKPYHRSRSVILMNENPVFLAYSDSAYGFIGRSVYQRTLQPLKSFLSTMVANDVVARKAGLIVAKIEQPGSIANRLMSGAVREKRDLLKESQNGEVLSVGINDDIKGIDLMNVDSSLTTSRQNIIEDIASGASMPSLLISAQTFSQARGDGTEDAKAVAQYVDGIRKWLRPLYDFFDTITMYRAWTPEFYETIQNDFPEYKDISFETAFLQWRRSFTAFWPSFLKEPESEQVEVEEVALKSLLGVFREFSPILDPENRARMVEWIADNMNDKKKLFSSPLELDYEALAQYQPPDPESVGPQAPGMDF